jgi:acyl phosphate:glycerol-3-phosphate acyltransferase
MMAGMLLAAALVPVGYVLGMFPTAVLVARAKGVDVTAAGSGNPGASNVARLLGWRWGALVMAIDFAKGALAAGIGLAAGDRPGAYLVGAAAVLGHTFPLLRKGGKGVAAGGGMLAVLFPLEALGLFVLWVAVAKLGGRASIASIVVCIAFPVTVGLAGYDWWEVLVIAGIAVFIVVQHRANIRRLVHRAEHAL